jgi:hypothetical protein
MFVCFCLFLVAMTAFLIGFRRSKRSRKEQTPDHSYIIWKDYTLPEPDQVKEQPKPMPEPPKAPADEEKIAPTNTDPSSVIRAVLDFEDTLD